MAFRIEIRIYRRNRKVDELAETKSFYLKETEAENLERLEIRVPYKLVEKGRYLFDVAVAADDPSVLSRRRQILKIKL